MKLFASALTLTVGCSFAPGALPSGGGSATDDAAIDAAPDTLDPLVDTDGDSVLDGSDNCIDVANLAQRDFDADGAGDACDACPHLPNGNADGDGDGVGDECDPQPQVATETRVLWTSFHEAAEIATWSANGQFAVSGSKLVHTTATEAHPSIAPPTAYQKTYAAMGVHLTQNAAGTSGIGLCTDTTGSNLYYCCELREGTGVVALSDWNGGGGYVAVTWPGTFTAGSRYRFVLNTLGSNTCTIREGSTSITASGPSDGPHDGLVFIYVDYAQAEIEYLFVVETT